MKAAAAPTPPLRLQETASEPPTARPPTTDIDGLFRAHGPELLRFLRGRTRGSEDAADLLQEVFARFARLAAPSRLDNPEAYLQRIAGNLLIDRRRAAASHVLHLPIEDLELVDPYPAADRQLEAKQMLARLDAVLDRLPPKTRDVFLLHRVHGLSYGEIASRMGLSVSGVEKHMSKAIAHLDRRLSRG